MKILLATVYPVIGGSSRMLLAAGQALRKEHEVVIRAPLDEATERLSTSFPPQSILSPWQKLLAIPLLLKIAVSEIGQLKGRQFDFIYVHDDPSLYIYGVISRFIGVHVVRHMHMSAQSNAMEWLRSKLAHQTIQISRHAAGDSGVPVIRNSIGAVRVERHPIAGELVVAGSICARKNQLLAVETLAVLAGKGMAGRLRLCGNVLEPGYADEVRERAGKLGVGDRVTFEGFVANTEYLASAACLLIPSLYENQPLSLLEAISVGVPVVASDIPAHRELVDLSCLDTRSLRALTADEFAAGAAARPEIDSKYSQRVRELFSERRFETEILDYFRRIEQDVLHHRAVSHS